MWFLIGSRAIKILDKDFYRDLSKSDLDLYCSENDFKDLLKNNVNIEKCFPLKINKYRLKITGFPIIELKIYSKNSIYYWLEQKEQKELLSKEKYYINELEINIPNIQCLTSIKESHIYWPIHWLKTIEDLTWLKVKSINLNLKEKQFKRKIRNEMRLLHGKIPFGEIKDFSYNELLPSIEKINKYDSFEKNLIYFIHYELSLKNKLKIINNWGKFNYLRLNVPKALESNDKKI